jgi:small basic protein
MNTIATICLWSALVGIALGLLLHTRVPEPFRSRTRRYLQVFGFASFPGIMAVILTGNEMRPLSTAMFTLGLLAGIPLATGVVMEALRRLPGMNPSTRIE